MAPTGFRPAGHDTSSRLVAQSNSTLNAWMPGRRQPSWLANTAPVAPSPRPPPQAQSPAPQPAQLPRQAPVATPSATPTTSTVAAVAPDPCPPRPVPLPSFETQHNINTQQVLPSPAPSDEVSTETLHSARSAEMSPASHQMASQPINQPPMPRQTENAAKFRTLLRDGQDGPDTMPHTAAPVASPVTGVASALSAPLPNPSPVIPSIPAGLASTSQSSRRSSTGGVGENPAKRRRTQQPLAADLLQSLRAHKTLTDYVNRFGGEHMLDASLESPRYHLLKNACECGDLFYIALHQVFCLWATDTDQVRRIFRKDDNHLSMAESAFGILGTILKSNSKMHPDILKFFANFPLPFANMQVYQQYTSALNMVMMFLFATSQSWMVLMNQHAREGYPLIMDEILGNLHLYSSVLQTIVFRASRRSAGVGDGPIATQIDSQFKKDQRIHMAADGTFFRKPHDPAYVKYLENLIARYKQLGHIARQQAQNASIQQSLPGQQQQQQSFQPGQMVPTQTQSPSMYVSPTLAQNQQWTTLPGQGIAPSQPAQAQSHVLASTMSPGGNFASIAAQAPGSAMSAMPPHLVQPRMAQPQWAGQPQRRASAQDLSRVSVNQYQYHTGQAPFMTSANPVSPIMAQHAARTSSTTEQQQSVPGMRYNQSPSMPPMLLSNASPVVASNNGLNRQFAPQPSQIRPNQQKQPPSPGYIPGMFFPEPKYRIAVQDYPFDPQSNVCILQSLHQAHLRSPRRVSAQLNTSERHYQSIRRLVLGPMPVAPRVAVNKFQFHLSSKDRDRLSRDDTLGGTVLPVHKFSSGSIRVRVRCCYLTNNKQDSQQKVTDSEWVVKETIWPEHIFMEVNCLPLTVRRKAHHSKDMPIELAPSLLLEENSLNVYVPEGGLRPREAAKGSIPYIAVEIIETLSHSAVLSLVKTHGVQKASDTLDLIRRRLTGSSSAKNDSNDDDDEIAMVSPDLSIDLADPFLAKIFTIPVRGVACTHLECFDLENWLNTRLGKKNTCFCKDKPAAPTSSSTTGPVCKKCPQEPSYADKWKCPICSADARPYSLRIDEWLLSVRTKLEEEGKLRAKSIFVDKDGDWRIRELPEDDSDEGDDDGDNMWRASGQSELKPAVRDAAIAAAAGAGGARPMAAAPVVIEIDDD